MRITSLINARFIEIINIIQKLKDIQYSITDFFPHRERYIYMYKLN